MKEKLHQFHIAILVVMVQVGISLFSIPSSLATYFGTNGWLALFFFSSIAAINIYLISLVYRKSNGESILSMLEACLPKLLLTPIYIGLIIIWSLLGCLIIKEYTLIFQMISFPTTPSYVFKIVVDMLVFLLLVKGIYNISKALTVFFYLTTWLVLLEIFHFKEFEWARLTPFIFQGETDFVQGFFTLFTAFLGYELCILLFPYVEKQSKFLKAMQIGNLLTTMIYLLVSVLSFGFFSFPQLRNMLFPVLDLLAYIQFPFIERVENLLYGIFIFTIIASAVMYYWASVEVAQRIAPKIKMNLLTFFIMSVTFIASFWFETMGVVQKWIGLLAKIEIGVAFGLPIFMLMVLAINRLKRGKEHVQK